MMPKPMTSAMSKTLRRVGLSLLPWLALLILWQWLAGALPSAVLPPPGDTLAQLGALVQRADFSAHLLDTLRRGVLGFGLAVGIGLPSGLLMGAAQWGDLLLRPLSQLSIAVPPIAWIALLVIWLGLGDGPVVVVVVVTTTPMVAVSVAEGLRALDPALLEMARAFRFSRWRTLRHVVLPGLRPQLNAALIVALRFTWRVLVMAEFLGSTSGLGNRLSWARQNVDTERVLAYTLLLVGISLLLEGLLRLLLTRPRRALRPPMRHASAPQPVPTCLYEGCGD